MRSYLGKCALSYDILKKSPNIDQNPNGVDFSEGNKKYHSNGFEYKESQDAYFLYDIAAEKDGSYVYAAAGDLGVLVYKNTNGVLTLDDTIRPQGIFKRSSSLIIGGNFIAGTSKGSCYGYERSPFAGVYSVAMSNEPGFVLAACGNLGVAEINRESGTANYILNTWDMDSSISSVVKAIPNTSTIVVGTTGYYPPDDTDKWHAYDDTYSNYPDEIKASGVYFFSIDKNGLYKETSNYKDEVFIGEEKSVIGVNDIFIGKPLLNESGENSDDATGSVLISLGKKVNRWKNPDDEDLGSETINRGGVSRLNFKITEDKDGIETASIIRESKDWGGNGTYSQPIFSAASVNLYTNNDGPEDIHTAIGTRYGKGGGNSHFPNNWDNGKSDVYSCAWSNGIINPSSESYDLTSPFARSTHYCQDTDLFFQNSGFAFEPFSQSVSMVTAGFDYLNSALKNNLECFTSSINAKNNILVLCIKAVGVIIYYVKENRIEPFVSLTRRLEDIDSAQCDKDDYWQSGGNFWGYNPSTAFVNFVESMSPVASEMTNKYLFVANSMQKIGNESGPGYIMNYNEDLESKFSVGGWTVSLQNHFSGILTFQDDQDQHVPTPTPGV